MAARDALDEAKRVHAAIVKLAERRERCVQKATGAFQIDLLATIRDVPRPILEMVERAVRYDQGQPHLQLALAIAIDERNEQARREHAEAETESPPATLNAVEAARAMRGLPPPRFEIEGDPGELAELESPMESDDAPAVLQRGSYIDVAGEQRHLHAGEFRYPEPGEPATLLPDGTVVALDSAESTA